MPVDANKLLDRLFRPSLLRGDLRLLWHRLRRPDVVSLQGVRLQVGKHLTPFIRDTLYSGAYETDEARLLRRYLRSEHTVVELGAGLGLLTTLCCKKIGSDRVFVYEANPELEVVLRESFQLNEVRPELNMCALGAESGEMRFYIRHAFWLSSGQENAMAKPEREVRVEVRDFDEEMARLPHQPDFLVCDIEGGEYDLFMGSELTGIKHILCEVHPNFLGEKKVAEMQARLHSKGFELIDATGKYDVWYLKNPGEPAL